MVLRSKGMTKPTFLGKSEIQLRDQGQHLTSGQASGPAVRNLEERRAGQEQDTKNHRRNDLWSVMHFQKQ